MCFEWSGVLARSSKRWLLALRAEFRTVFPCFAYTFIRPLRGRISYISYIRMIYVYIGYFACRIIYGAQPYFRAVPCHSLKPHRTQLNVKIKFMISCMFVCSGEVRAAPAR